MPGVIGSRLLGAKIANIQDDTYPLFDNVAPDRLLALRPRPGYRRHLLLGINLFVMRMFQQFASTLGVAFDDENIASNERPVPSLLFADRQALRIARDLSAAVQLALRRRGAAATGTLEAVVSVTNLAGHKLPSGVGFRRVFLELAVLDGNGATLWASGRTDAVGTLVDGAGRPLPSELSTSRWEPHHQVITGEDQAQIYESRHLDSRGQLTTSFLALSQEVKDNRFLPRGWRRDGPYADLTAPIAIDGDGDYFDGTGRDRVTYRIPLAAIDAGRRVRATLYYQSIPPYYLAERFRTAQGPETRRLYYLASRLAVAGSALAGWKLALASAQQPMP